MNTGIALRDICDTHGQVVIEKGKRVTIKPTDYPDYVIVVGLGSNAQYEIMVHKSMVGEA